MAHIDDFPDFDIIELPNDVSEKDVSEKDKVEVKPRIVAKKVIPKNTIDLDRQIDMCIKYICQRIQKREPSNWYKNHANFSITLKEKMDFCADRINYFIHKYKGDHSEDYESYYTWYINGIIGNIKEETGEIINEIIVEHLKFKSNKNYKIKSKNDNTAKWKQQDIAFVGFNLIVLMLYLCYHIMFEK